ncbi:MAG: hypothetical protein ACK4N5_11980 [Myxococcales bacterium]
MSRKRRDDGRPAQDWGSERTLADAESEETILERAETDGEPARGQGSEPVCACGSTEFLLEAYMAVVDGRIRAEPVEVEQLTCPQCGREYEAIPAEGGRILRGDFLGYAEL